MNENAAPLEGRDTVTVEGQPMAPAGAASERCWRMKEPDFAEQCTNDAAGGVRLVLFASKTIQKRWGKRPMLQMILDLPVCPECFSRMKPAEVLSDEQWRVFSKVAQQRNNGVLAVREESEIEHVPFNDPEYRMLREQMAKARAANDSQPGQAGPQPEGAGNA